MLNLTGTRTLETERLILRRFTVDDAEDMYYGWANDPEVTKFLTWEPHESPEATRTLLEAWVAGYADNVFMWLTELKETGKPVGSISVVVLNEKHNLCEIGYCIGRAHWNMGITSEAFAAVIDYLFGTVNLNRIAAYHDTLNPASGRVMEKCGLRLEGTLRGRMLRKDGSYADHNLWAILRSDWEEARGGK